MKISVLGCGWLGFPLAIRLLEDGFEVNGSTTNPQKLNFLKKHGITPFEVKFSPQLITPLQEEFWFSDVLVINIPPSRFSDKSENFHIIQIESILKFAKRYDVKNILYVSSTSVYPECNQLVDEDTEINAHNTQHYAIWEAENRIRNSYGKASTIVRMGGLMGANRIPGKYFSGKSVENFNVPVNYIHRTDAVEIIRKIIHQQCWGEILNAVAPYHPTRKEVFQHSCVKMKLPLPHFIDTNTQPPYKIVDSSKVQKLLNYAFRYPNPTLFDYDEIIE
ncbi:MAG: NAD(P)H-binding protein [Cytophagales bacterium]|nr:NAD(P)H-binding protein [Cytophagales bacterium]MDW8384051.1 NAD(P)H-binding protein [Flammeovirgaceae bacterium]